MIDQILLNQTDKIEIDVYYNGILTAPTSISIKSITDPDGVIRLVNQTASAGSTTGRYYFNVPASITDKLGVHIAVWEFTIGSTVFNHVQNYEVVSTLRSGYITVDQFRDMSLYSRVTDSFPSDETIQKHINRATRLIDNYLGGSLEYKQYTETQRCVIDKVHGGFLIQLSKRPIVSLTSVSIMTTPASITTIDVDDVRINTRAGYLEYLYDYTIPALNVCLHTITSIIPHATVTYTAGYTTMPEQVVEAAVLITEDLLRNTFDEGKEIDTIQIAKDKVRYADSFETRRAKQKIGIGNAIGAIELLKNYRHRTNIIAGPLG
jgi:hypothetical protein